MHNVDTPSTSGNHEDLVELENALKEKSAAKAKRKADKLAAEANAQSWG